MDLVVREAGADEVRPLRQVLFALDIRVPDRDVWHALSARLSFRQIILALRQDTKHTAFSNWFPQGLQDRIRITALRTSYAILDFLQLLLHLLSLFF